VQYRSHTNPNNVTPFCFTLSFDQDQSAKSWWTVFGFTTGHGEDRLQYLTALTRCLCASCFTLGSSRRPFSLSFPSSKNVMWKCCVVSQPDWGFLVCYFQLSRQLSAFLTSGLLCSTVNTVERPLRIFHYCSSYST